MTGSTSLEAKVIWFRPGLPYDPAAQGIRLLQQLEHDVRLGVLSLRHGELKPITGKQQTCRTTHHFSALLVCLPVSQLSTATTLVSILGCSLSARRCMGDWPPKAQARCVSLLLTRGGGMAKAFFFFEGYPRCRVAQGSSDRTTPPPGGAVCALLARKYLKIDVTSSAYERGFGR